MSRLAHKKAGSRLILGAALIGIFAIHGTARGQSLQEQIPGAWRLVSIYNEVNGVKIHHYGENPVGLAVFDRSGYIISFLSKPGLPKFAGNNRLKGTDEECRTVMQGMDVKRKYWPNRRPAP